MSEKIESKAKTIEEIAEKAKGIIQIYDWADKYNLLKEKWIPLEEAQRLEMADEASQKMIKLLSKSIIALQTQINKANEIIIEEKPATFSIHGDYEEDKIDYLNDKLKRINEVLK